LARVCKQVPVFSPTSTLNVEIAWFSSISLCAYKTTRFCSSASYNLNTHRHERSKAWTFTHLEITRSISLKFNLENASPESFLHSIPYRNVYIESIQRCSSGTCMEDGDVSVLWGRSAEGGVCAWERWSDDSRLRIVNSDWKVMEFLRRLSQMPRQYIKIDKLVSLLDSSECAIRFNIIT
jgi:hypothetical protein